jgi:cytoskeletal protein CcmA (bactofilin family)
VASKKTKVVDGFTAIRAAQEAARHGRGDPLRPDAEAAKKPEPDGGAPKAGSRIGRSVMPSKREIICPECAGASEVTGMVKLFVCNHCRHRMNVEDVQIPEGDWSDELEVGGTVIVPTGAVLKGGKITANDIILQGTMSGTELKACRLITIGSNAKPDWVRLTAYDMELGAGVNLTPGKPIHGRNLILHGKFSGNAVLTGTLTIHPDGDFSGQVKAAGLQVEEGGGLRAQLDINPDYKPPPPKQQRRAPPPKPSKLRPPPPKARPDRASDGRKQEGS